MQLISCCINRFKRSIDLTAAAAAPVAAVLLAIAAKYSGIQQELFDGWGPNDALCTGPQTPDTAWTGIVCADPINKPGVVGKM
jgi:hypothetical protein